jgi:hypothetical protein
MVNGFKWLAFIAAIWIIRELVVSFWTWRKIRRLDHVMRVERTRAQFAKARNSLMHIALKEQIDPNSATFKVLYNVDTVFMRSADKYPELSKSLQETMLTDNRKPHPQILAEKEHWTKEVRENIIATSKAMDNVITDYSVLFWIASHIAKRRWLAEPVASGLTKIKCYLERKLEKRNPDLWEIKRAQAVMHDMAAA